MFSTRKLIHNVVGLMTGRMMMSIMRLVTVLLIARFGGVETFGAYILVMSVIFIVEWLVDFGVNDIVVRNACSDRTRMHSWLKSAVGVRAFQVIIAICALPIAFNFFDVEYYLVNSLVAAVGVVCYGMALLYRIIARVNLKMHRDVANEAVGNLVTLVFSLCAIYFQWGLIGLIGAHAAGRLVYLLNCIGAFWRCAGVATPIKNLKPIVSASKENGVLIRQALPLGLGGLLAVCYDNLAPFVLAQLLSLEAVGYYAAAVRFVVPVVVLMQAISQVFYTPLSGLWRADRKQFSELQQTCLEVTLFLSGLAFSVLYGGATFYMGFFGDTFSESIDVFKIVIWSLLAKGMTLAMSLPIIIAGQQGKTLWITALVVVFTLTAFLLIVPIYGVKGAATTFVVVEFCVTGIPILFMSQYWANYRINLSASVKLMLAAVVSASVVTLFKAHSGFGLSVVSGFVFVSVAMCSKAVCLDRLKALVFSRLDDSVQSI